MISNNTMQLSEESEEQVRPPYAYYKQQLVRTIHHFYFSQVVEHPSLYTDMIHQIQMAGSDSTICIHLNTPGGQLDTGIQLINAMQTTEAHVVCSLEGNVASLGTLIFLAADEFIVHDNCMMMFHNYSGGTFGKGHEQVAALEATTKWVEDIMNRVYIPFMSQEEVDRIKRGEDLYFHSPEIRERLNKMVEQLHKEQEDAEKQPKVAPKKKPAAKKKAVTKKKRTTR